MESKKFTILISVLFGVLILLFGFGVFSNAHYSRMFMEQLNTANTETAGQHDREVQSAEQSKDQSADAEQLQATISDLEEKLNATTDELEKCEELLAQIIADRSTDNDKYYEWYKSLYDEIKKLANVRKTSKAEENPKPEPAPEPKQEEPKPDNNDEQPSEDDDNTEKEITVENISSVKYDTSKYSNDNIKHANTDREYFVNAASQKAYIVPASEGVFTGQAEDDFSQAMLSDVFGITETYGSGYRYIYDDAGYLSIYRDCDLAVGENKAVTAQILSDEFAYMVDSQGNSLKDAVDHFVTQGGSLDKLKYSYSSDGILTLTQDVLVADTKMTDMNVGDSLSTYETAIGTLFGKLGALYNTISATFVDYNTIVAVINDTSFTTYTANEVAAAAAIKLILDSAQLPGKMEQWSYDDVKFALLSIAGDPGIKISYIGTKEVPVPFPDANASTAKKYRAKAVASEHYREAYVVKKPKYVFNNLNTYGTCYYLLGDSLERDVTLSTINEAFLRAVFPKADKDITKLISEMKKNPKRQYKMTISSSGYLKVTHKEPR